MRSIVFLWLVLLLMTRCSQTKRSDTTVPDRMVRDFFGTYESRGPTAALQALLPTNPYISHEVTDSVAAKIERLTRDMGKYEGYEQIAESTYGQGIYLVTCVAKYERQPLRFNFKFYKPGDVWKLHHFTYESDFLNELDETVRPYRLKENEE